MKNERVAQRRLPTSSTRRALQAARVLVLATVLLGAGLITTRPTAAEGVPDFVEIWSHALRDAGAPVALSSPNVATLGGTRAVIVGDRSGHVYAFSLATGQAIRGWPASTGGIPVDST